MCRSSRWLAWGLTGALVMLPAWRVMADTPAPATDTRTDEAPPVVPPDTPSGTSAPVPPIETPVATPAQPPVPKVIPPAVDFSAVATVSARRTEIVYKRPRRGLLVGGIALFAAGWVADIGFTYGYKHDPAWTSLIPFAGPFIQLTQTYGLEGPAIDTGSSDADARANKTLDQANSTIKGLAFTGAIVCGVAQLAGLALTIAGASTKRKVMRYVDAGGNLRVRF